MTIRQNKKHAGQVAPSMNGKAAHGKKRAFQTPVQKTQTEPAVETMPPAKKSRPARQKQNGGKLSALDAAAKVLGETGQPMTCKEMIEMMATKGYWQSPGGRTPEATLYSAILRKLKVKGADTRFRKTDRGKFARV